MSRKNCIIRSNKNLLDSRQHINTNSNYKINTISFDNRINNNNNISLNKPIHRFIIEENNDKKQNSSFNNSFFNNNRNNSLDKKFKKNRNKKKNININYGNTNLLSSEIKNNQFLGNYNSHKDSILKNKNKLHKNRSNNKSVNVRKIDKKYYLNNSLNKKINKKKKELLQFNSMKVISEKNLIINLKNKNMNISNNINFKDKIMSKYILKNKYEYSRNNSSIKKNRNNNKYNSFVFNKNKKIKYDKKIETKNINTIYDCNTNYKGRNIKKRYNNNINNISKKLNDDFQCTQKNLYKDKNKNFSNISKNTFLDIKFTQNNSTLKKNGNSIYNEIKDSNIINIKKYNQNNKKISRNDINNINKKLTYNKSKCDKNTGIKTLISFNDPKKIKANKIYEKLGDIKNKKNFQSLVIKNKKNNNKIDKKEEIIKDYNGTSTKSNDEFFSEYSDKIKESSIEEESGILSVNEIEDIIHYNNMSDINKEDNYLFYKNERTNFYQKYNNKLNKLFFGNKKHNKSYRQSKIKIKKKVIEVIDNSEDYKYYNTFNEIKIISYKNSSKKKYKY